MNGNGLQEVKTLEEQLEALKQEQAEAERIYRGRMQLGALNHDPASVQVLAQTILDRKMQIEDLEAQIARTKQPVQEIDEKEENKEYYNRETALTEYHQNPILNWLQKVINKLDQVSAKLDQSIENAKRRINRDPSMMKEPKAPKGLRNKWEQYQDVVDMDFSKHGQEQKSAHQLFVDKLSGNGAYHTFKSNGQNLEEQTNNIPEINKNISSQVKDDTSR